jgi:7-cyano-7-deazaguanine synthase
MKSNTYSQIKTKHIIVVHSGGMDSSICLALAIQHYGKKHVLSLGFDYTQRNSSELQAAELICNTWEVDRVVLPITCLNQITSNALLNHKQTIEHLEGQAPNTLVTGRNGLMARLAGIHADSLGASAISLGVIEIESSNSGYRDCSREYFNLLQNILRIDFNNPLFEIQTPLVKMTKYETLKCAQKLDVLDFLLEHTITCYEGLAHQGCKKCPACKLRNQGIEEFQSKHPAFKFKIEDL